MRRRRAIAGILVSWLACVAAAQETTDSATARTLVVPDQFPTIQQAIDAAEAGDTVQVQPGDYRERITFKDGVRLIGTDKEKCRIEAEKEDFSTLIGASQCSGLIANLTLDGRADILKDATTVAIRLDRCKMEVRDCVAQKLSFGFQITGTDGKVVLNRNVVRDCKYFALSIEDSSGVAEGNLCELSGTGIRVAGAGAKATLTRNTCRQNRVNGITILKGAAAEVIENTCEANTYQGIDVEGSGDPGAAATNTTANLLRNTCRDNAASGILFSDGAAGIAEGNACHGNKHSGISVSSPGASPQIEKNVCRENGYSGISIGAGVSGAVAHNICEGNAAAGISVVGADARPHVQGNQCTANEQYGLIVLRGADPIIGDDNVWRDNKKGPTLIVAPPTKDETQP